MAEEGRRVDWGGLRKGRERRWGDGKRFSFKYPKRSELMARRGKSPHQAVRYIKKIKPAYVRKSSTLIYFVLIRINTIHISVGVVN